MVALLHRFQFLILVVNDLEEEHPAELGDALGIAIDTTVLAHDVLDGFYGIPYGHELSDFLVKGGLEFVHSFLKTFSSAEGFEQFDGGTHGVEGRHLQDSRSI